ncbi:hypothetical protein ISCGN_000145 [Ixodes scapularis]
MPSATCSAVGCSNNPLRNTGVLFHKCPTDRKLEKVWVNALRRVDFGLQLLRARGKKNEKTVVYSPAHVCSDAAARAGEPQTYVSGTDPQRESERAPSTVRHWQRGVKQRRSIHGAQMTI